MDYLRWGKKETKPKYGTDYMRWGKKEINPEHGNEHFLVVGASGSGKTTLINMMLKSILSSKRSLRAMVYDPKQEALPYLYDLVDPVRIKVLHPFDSRASAWKLAEDIDGPISARQLATILIPEARDTSGSESFFVSAVRDLLTGVILAFINCVPNPKAWTFRDIILTMLYEPYLRYILEMGRTRDDQPFPMTSRLLDSYLAVDPQRSDPRTTSNIRASINTKLAIYEPVAASWHLAEKAKQTFSLTQWVKDDCRDVLVLGNDEASRAAIDAINQAIFKRTTELLLARREMTPNEKETGENQTWFFLDEVREAGELDGLSRLLTKGRSKGACILLGFQDIDGMRQAYGEEIAHEICGQCNNIAVLKLNSPSTAEWATEVFGRRLAESRSRSHSHSSEGGLQMGHEAGEDERPWLYTSDFLYLPSTSTQTGLHGFFRSPDVDPKTDRLSVKLDWATDIEKYLPKRHSDVVSKEAAGGISIYSSLHPRPVSEHYLKPWDKDDWTRLGFRGPIPHWQSEPTLIEQKREQNEQRREPPPSIERD